MDTLEKALKKYPDFYLSKKKAAGKIDAGDAVGIMQGYERPEVTFDVIGEQTFDLEDLIVKDPSTIYISYFKVDNLSSDKFVAAWCENVSSPAGFVRVGELSGNQIVWLTDAAQFTIDTSGINEVSNVFQIEDDKFAIVYSVSSQLGLYFKMAEYNGAGSIDWIIDQTQIVDDSQTVDYTSADLCGPESNRYLWTRDSGTYYFATTWAHSNNDGRVAFHRITPGRREETTVTHIADTDGSLNGKYWTFSSTVDDYYVWYANKDVQYFNFEQSLEDQNRINPWVDGYKHEDIEYKTNSKFGSYSIGTDKITPADRTYNTEANGPFAKEWTRGKSQGAFFWVYPTDFNRDWYNIFLNVHGGTDSFAIQENDSTIRLRVTKNSVDTDITNTQTLNKNAWNFVGYTYDGATDTAYIIVNSNVDSAVIGGSWGAGGASPKQEFNISTQNEWIADFDDMLVVTDNYVSSATAVSYYVSAQNWEQFGYPSQEPSVIGKTGIKVLFETNDTADTLAEGARKKLNFLKECSASNSSSNCVLWNLYSGAVTHSADVDTGFTIVSTSTGDSNYRVETVTTTYGQYEGTSVYSAFVHGLDGDRAHIIWRDAGLDVSNAVAEWDRATGVNFVPGEKNSWNTPADDFDADVIFENTEPELTLVASTGNVSGGPYLDLLDLVHNDIYSDSGKAQIRSIDINANPFHPRIKVFDNDKFVLAYAGSQTSSTRNPEILATRIGKWVAGYHAAAASDTSGHGYENFLYPFPNMTWPLNEEYILHEATSGSDGYIPEVRLLQFSNNKWVIFYADYDHSVTKVNFMGVKILEYKKDGVVEDDVDEHEILPVIEHTTDPILFGTGYSVATEMKITSCGNNTFFVDMVRDNNYQQLQTVQYDTMNDVMYASSTSIASTGTVGMTRGADQYLSGEGVLAHSYRHTNNNCYLSAWMAPHIARASSVSSDQNDYNFGFGANQGSPSISRLGPRNIIVSSSDSSTNKAYVRVMKYYGSGFTNKTPQVSAMEDIVIDDKFNNIGNPSKNTKVIGMDNQQFLFIISAHDGGVTTTNSYSSSSHIIAGRFTPGANIEWLTKLQKFENLGKGEGEYENEGMWAIDATYLGDYRVAVIYQRLHPIWDKTGNVYETAANKVYIQIIEWNPDTREIIFPCNRMLVTDYYSTEPYITQIQGNMFAISYSKESNEYQEVHYDDAKYAQRYWRIGQYNPSTTSVEWRTIEMPYGPAVTDSVLSRTIYGGGIACSSNGYIALCYKDESDSDIGKIIGVKLKKVQTKKKYSGYLFTKPSIEWLTDEIQVVGHQGTMTNEECVTPLGGSRFAITWRDDANAGDDFIRIGEYANGDIHWLTDRTKWWITNIGQQPQVKKLADNRFVMGCYRDDNTDGYQVVAEYDDGDIYIRTPEKYFSTYSLGANILPFTENSWVTMFDRYNGSAHELRARVMYYNSAIQEITFMTGEANIRSGIWAWYLRADTLENPLDFVTVSRHVRTSYYGYSGCSRYLWNHSSTDGNDGSFADLTGNYQFNDSARVDWQDVAHIGNNVFVVFWQDQARNDAPTTRVMKYNDDYVGGAGTGTISYLTPRDQIDSSSGGYYNTIESIGDGKVIMAWRNYDHADSQYIMFAQWKNDSLEYMTDAIQTNRMSSYDPSIKYYGNGLFSLSYKKQDQGNVIMRFGKIPQLVGIAESSTETPGEEIYARSTGINNDQQNLVPGSNYYIDYRDGLIKNAGGHDRVGKAISSTELLIKRDTDEFRRDS
jgi:hypothetical protein